MKEKNLLQRVLAFAMAVIMVMGYLPAGAAAETENAPITFFSASIAKTQTGGDVVEGEETETEPVTFTYKVTVLDPELQDITDKTGISWTGSEVTGDTFTTTEEYASATVMYNGLILRVNSEAPAAWTVDQVVWNPILSQSGITEPDLRRNKDAASFVTAPVWTMTYGDGVAVKVGDKAELSMGTLTATTTVAGVPFTVSTTVVPVPVEVVDVTPAAGWYGELPAEVTVVGDNDVTLKDSEATLRINGEDVAWVEKDGKYEISFVPVEGAHYTIGGESYVWSVDASAPSLDINYAYVNDEGKTVVEYTYSVGDSRGWIVFSDNQVVYLTNSSGTEQITLNGVFSEVFAILKNGLNQPVAVEAKKQAFGVPENISCSGYLSKTGAVTYVGDSSVLTFTFNGAQGTVHWAVNGKEMPGVNGTVLDVPVTEEYIGNAMTVIARDGFGRQKAVTIPVITLDKEAPAIVITAPEDEVSGYETVNYFAKNRSYEIQITDNAVLGECTAYAEINGKSIPVTLTDGKGTVEVKNGQTLTGISVSAQDQNGNVSEAAYKTNVCVDTEKPVITGSISITYYDETLGQHIPGTVSSLYSDGSVNYVVLDNGANNETAVGSRDVTVTVHYTLKETNPTGNWEQSSEKTIVQTVKLNEVKTIDLSVSAVDKAGNVALDRIHLGEHIVLESVNGTYTETVTVDRRTPEDIMNDPLTSAPEVTMGIEGDCYTDENGIRYFNGDFRFVMDVADADSGLSNANIVMKASAKGIHPDPVKIKLSEDGKGVVQVSVAPGYEDANGNVNLKIYDNVGNYYYYNEKIAVDSRAPRVTVEMKRTVVPVNVDGIDFYQEPVKLNFALEDMLASTAVISYTVNGEAKTMTISGTNEKATLEIKGGEKLTALSVVATDAAGNTTNSFTSYTFANPIEVDGDPAEVTIKKSIASPEESANSVDYYSEAVELTVSVSDKNILNVEGTMSYTVSGVEHVVDIQDVITDEDGKNKITIGSNDILTSLVICVKDGAGNITKDLLGDLTDYEYRRNNDTVQYTGNFIAVDKEAPEVTVEKTLVNSEYVQTLNGKAYYKDGEVVYTVTVKDEFLNMDATSVAFNGVAAKAVCKEGPLHAVDTMTFTFTAKDEATLKAIVIDAVDMIGNKPEAAAVTDPVEDVTFACEDGVLTYNGPEAVVDTKAPEVTMLLSGDIYGMYTKNGTYYVILNQPVSVGVNGIFGNDKETVEVKVTVEDENIVIGAAENQLDNTYLINNADNNVEWELNDGSAVYTDTVTVGMHEAACLKIDLGAYDLSGHPAVLNVIAMDQVESETIKVNKEGQLQLTVTLDRRAPSSIDNDTPEIVLTDGFNDENPKYMTLDGLDLYPNAFGFKLSVKDGKEEYSDEQNSGLESVEAVLRDTKNAVAQGANFGKHLFEDYTPSFNCSLGIEGVAETDDLEVNIEAVDNVGNTVSYSKRFAYDTMAPRVKVTVDGESVRENEYYNKTRTAVVEVTDLHLPGVEILDQYVTVTTEGTPSGWVKNGSTYTNTYTFSKDGEYTISVEAHDMAGHYTYNENVVYEGENPQKFVIDKTAPVLTVAFDPAAPSGMDGAVQHYKDNVTVGFTIREKNFDSKDVTAKFNPAHITLGAWAGDLDHRTSVHFTQGNNYSFSIDFWDLAGNRLDRKYTSPTFCVDTTDPTIVVSRGELAEGEMNIVPDDLNLELTVNDAQNNLDIVNVTLIHLNNEFQAEEVSGAEYYTVEDAENRTTVVVNFNKIAREKKNDGLYTLKVEVEDFAGNEASLAETTLSLNRFGSTFTTANEATKNFLSANDDGNVYSKSIDEALVLQEINPNQVYQDESMKQKGSALTVMINGSSSDLEEGTHYNLNVEEKGTQGSKWYVYTYEIKPEAFRSEGTLKDGRYAILMYGVDEAGNKNTNEANASGDASDKEGEEYTGKMEFILDSKAPVISVSGIESRKVYNAVAQQMQIFLSDNTPVNVSVYLNETLLNQSEEALSSAEAWVIFDSSENCYVVNVPEQNKQQNLRIVATDAADNTAEVEVVDFSVSTNFFVRLINSSWFIGGLILLLILLAALVLKRMKKKA